MLANVTELLENCTYKNFQVRKVQISTSNSHKYHFGKVQIYNIIVGKVFSADQAHLRPAVNNSKKKQDL
jgi:hypothetical protein